MQGLRVQDGANGIQLVDARAHRDDQVGGNRSTMRMPCPCIGLSKRWSRHLTKKKEDALDWKRCWHPRFEALLLLYLKPRALPSRTWNLPMHQPTTYARSHAASLTPTSAAHA